ILRPCRTAPVPAGRLTECGGELGERREAAAGSLASALTTTASTPRTRADASIDETQPSFLDDLAPHRVPLGREAQIVRASQHQVAALLLCAASVQAGEPKYKVDGSTFQCITKMTPVKHFFVDNLAGNLAGTVDVAKAGKGQFPEGTVLQLIPNE